MASPDERVAALEAHRENDVKLLTEMSGKLDTVADDVLAIKLGLEGQKGFMKGVLAVLLPIWSLVTAGFLVVAKAVWDWWQRGGNQQ
jgi:hypothetical protein